MGQKNYYFKKSRKIRKLKKFKTIKYHNKQNKQNKQSKNKRGGAANILNTKKVTTVNTQKKDVIIDVDGEKVDVTTKTKKKPCKYDNITCSLQAMAEEIQSKTELIQNRESFGRLIDAPEASKLTYKNKNRSYLPLCNGGKELYKPPKLDSRQYFSLSSLTNLLNYGTNYFYPSYIDLILVDNDAMLSKQIEGAKKLKTPTNTLNNTKKTVKRGGAVKTANPSPQNAKTTGMAMIPGQGLMPEIITGADGVPRPSFMRTILFPQIVREGHVLESHDDSIFFRKEKEPTCYAPDDDRLEYNLPIGKDCKEDNQCQSNMCSSKKFLGVTFPGTCIPYQLVNAIGNGGVCMSNMECKGGLQCLNGRCSAVKYDVNMSDFASKPDQSKLFQGDFKQNKEIFTNPTAGLIETSSTEMPGDRGLDCKDDYECKKKDKFSRCIDKKCTKDYKKCDPTTQIICSKFGDIASVLPNTLTAKRNFNPESFAGSRGCCFEPNHVCVENAAATDADRKSKTDGICVGLKSGLEKDISLVGDYNLPNNAMCKTNLNCKSRYCDRNKNKCVSVFQTKNMLECDSLHPCTLDHECVEVGKSNSDTNPVRKCVPANPSKIPKNTVLSQGICFKHEQCKSSEEFTKGEPNKSNESNESKKGKKSKKSKNGESNNESNESNQNWTPRCIGAGEESGDKNSMGYKLEQELQKSHVKNFKFPLHKVSRAFIGTKCGIEDLRDEYGYSMCIIKQTDIEKFKQTIEAEKKQYIEYFIQKSKTYVNQSGGATRPGFQKGESPFQDIGGKSYSRKNINPALPQPDKKIFQKNPHIPKLILFNNFCYDNFDRAASFDIFDYTSQNAIIYYGGKYILAKVYFQIRNPFTDYDPDTTYKANPFEFDLMCIFVDHTLPTMKKGSSINNLKDNLRCFYTGHTDKFGNLAKYSMFEKFPEEYGLKSGTRGAIKLETLKNNNQVLLVPNLFIYEYLVLLLFGERFSCSPFKKHEYAREVLNKKTEGGGFSRGFYQYQLNYTEIKVNERKIIMNKEITWGEDLGFFGALDVPYTSYLRGVNNEIDTSNGIFFGTDILNVDLDMFKEVYEYWWNKITKTDYIHLDTFSNFNLRKYLGSSFLLRIDNKSIFKMKYNSAGKYYIKTTTSNIQRETTTTTKTTTTTGNLVNPSEQPELEQQNGNSKLSKKKKQKNKKKEKQKNKKKKTQKQMGSNGTTAIGNEHNEDNDNENNEHNDNENNDNEHNDNENNDNENNENENNNGHNGGALTISNERKTAIKEILEQMQDPNNLSSYIMLKKHAKPVNKNRGIEFSQEVELDEESHIANNTFNESSFNDLEFYSVFKDFFN